MHFHRARFGCSSFAGCERLDIVVARDGDLCTEVRQHLALEISCEARHIDLRGHAELLRCVSNGNAVVAAGRRDHTRGRQWRAEQAVKRTTRLERARHSASGMYSAVFNVEGKGDGGNCHSEQR